MPGNKGERKEKEKRKKKKGESQNKSRSQTKTNDKHQGVETEKPPPAPPFLVVGPRAPGTPHAAGRCRDHNDRLGACDAALGAHDAMLAGVGCARRRPRRVHMADLAHVVDQAAARRRGVAAARAR